MALQKGTGAGNISALNKVMKGNRLHYLADRAGIRGLFSDADAYHLDQAFPLLMKQLELMLTSGELNPRHQH
ncbi:type IV toxin-antitoxin system YeeU family antitoxin, partial [Escherichia coli]